jgi:transcription elongation factor SPT5
MSSSDESGDGASGFSERRRPANRGLSLSQFRDDLAADSDSGSNSETEEYSSEDYSGELKDLIASDSDEGESYAPRPFETFDAATGPGRGARKPKRRSGPGARSVEAEKRRKLAQHFEQQEERVQTEVELLDDDQASFATPLEQWRIALTPNGSRHLFMLATKPGREGDVVVALMRRFVTHQATQEPFGTIYSAFFKSAGSGCVFVEALTGTEVSAFRNNIPAVYFAKPPRPIPVDEMASAMRVPPASARVAPGQFVRINRDVAPRIETYKGDLGQVVHVDVNSNRALVKLVPRIDYALLQQQHLADPGDATPRLQSRIVSMKKGGSYRPPQAEFNETAVREFGGECSPGRFPRKIPALRELPKATIWDDTIFVGTFAYKEYPIRHLETDEINPASDETKKFIDGLRVTVFEHQIPGFEQNMVRSLGRTFLSTFEVGDVVRVRAGNEFSGLKVVVKTITGDIVTVKPIEKQWEDQTLEFQRTVLERFFSEGDRVKISGGEYANETGQVVAVDESEGKADIVLDSHHLTVGISLHQIQPTKDVNRGQKTAGLYTVLDAVRLADNSEGVIYRIENNLLHVLLTNGETKSVNLAVVAHKAKAQHVKDRTGKVPLPVGQMVKVDQGGHTLRARVVHTTSHCVFVFSEELQENRGVKVVDPRDCHAPQTAVHTQELVGVRRSTIDPRRHELVGKTVKILNGDFKGGLADVKEADDSIIRVVLQSSGKRLNLNRSDGDGRVWQLISKAGSKGRPDASDPFHEIFNPKPVRKAYDVPEPLPFEPPRGPLEAGVPVNYGPPMDQGGWDGYRPRQPWEFGEAAPYRTPGAPYTGATPYSGSPFSTGPNYGQPNYGTPQQPPGPRAPPPPKYG